MLTQPRTAHSAERQLLAIQALIMERRYGRRATRGEAAAQTLASDPAMYTCECGQVFHAPVSTHVACPGCGHDQLW